jgi:tetratricopeptide (TPR) repeat protein
VPASILGYRVFIASPSGLDDERRKFKDVLSDFNIDEGVARGLHYLPIGWELTLPGMGRPQDLINEDVRRCDYLFLILHDQWGHPTGNGVYDSGTYEEYQVALDCYKTKKTMMDIVVLFKGVPTERLSDPGPQLNKVLSFKKQLEAEHKLLYGAFGNIDDFARQIRRRLQSWTLQHETGREASNAQSAGTVKTGSRSPARARVRQDLHEILRQAEEKRREGRISEAEQLYASALEGDSHLEAFVAYSRFLRDTGQYPKAEQVLERLWSLADTRESDLYRVQAKSNMGRIKRKQGLLDLSREYFEQALKIARTSNDPDALNQIPATLDDLGISLRKMGELSRATEVLQESLRIRRQTGDQLGLATTLNNLGALHRLERAYDEAARCHNEAILIFQEQGSQSKVASARTQLALVYEDLGNLNTALLTYESALAVNRETQNIDGMAMNHSQLARVLLARREAGDLKSAAMHVQECGDLNERTGNPEGRATALQLEGELALARSDFPTGFQLLNAALKSFRSVGLPLGIAGTAYSLAELWQRMGDLDTAKRFAEEGLAAAEQGGHGRLIDMGARLVDGFSKLTDTM